ncbi:MAG: hypothetical protein NTW19_13780 [Planctomycetota bacterium]|nr:hypothetical protein [Planctomycetota bacterium]
MSSIRMFEDAFAEGWPGAWKFHPSDAPACAKQAATPPSAPRGDWRSPTFAVAPDRWHRLRVKASTPGQLFTGVMYLDVQGNAIAADCYPRVDDAAGPDGAETFFRGREGSTQAWLTVHPPDFTSPVKLERVEVAVVEESEVGAWADRSAVGLPPLGFTPPADRFRFLPRTRAALDSGKPLRIVLLGDSIANDTTNSPFDVLLARVRPGVALTIIPSVRSSTGCEYYAQAGRVRSYVLDQRPDLVIIAGASHRWNVEAIRSVVRQIRAGCNAEILLLTSAVVPLARRSSEENKWLKPDEARRRLDFFGLALQATANYERVASC